MLVRLWNKQNSHTLLLGVQNGKTTLKTMWRFLGKLNIQSSCDPTIILLSKSKEHTHTHTPPKDSYTNVYSSFMHNGPNLK